MIGQAQGILTSSGSALKGLAGVHPVALGVVVGIGAYYAVNKYLLNSDDDEADEVDDEMVEAEEELEEDTATA